MIRPSPLPRPSRRKLKAPGEAIKKGSLPLKREAISPEEILLKYWPQISHRVKNSIGHLTPDWEDVASEILVGVIEAIRKGTFRGESALGTFIYSITTHKIVDHIRQRKKAVRAIPEAGPSSDPYLEVEQEERVKLVAELLKSLKPRFADILYLYYYLELSRNEIARIYDISPGRVGELITSATNTLKNLIKNLGLPSLPGGAARV